MGPEKRGVVFLIMKKIYIFGGIVRISFLISCIFLLYAMVEIVISRFDLKNLFLLLVSVCFVIIGLIWIYSLGIFIDKKNDKFKIVTGLSKRETRERVLSNIVSVDVELNGDIGMIFIINYKYSGSEKIQYNFYRISFVEKAQYRRIKKHLSKLKF